MFNRRGHIGTLLMVFGALFLVVVALFNFAGFKDNAAETKKELRKISIKVDYDFALLSRALKSVLLKSVEEAKDSNDFKLKFEERLKENAKLERTSSTNNSLFAKLDLGEFTVEKSGEEYLLKVNELNIKNENGLNEVIQRFDLNVKFDKNKKVEIVKIPR